MTRDREWSWPTKPRSRRRKFILALGGFIMSIAIVRILFLPRSYLRNSRVEDFMRDWCRIRQARVDWEQLLKPCEGKTTWGAKDDGWDRTKQTDPDTSYILLWDVRPAGEFSRFSIQSQTAAGRPKKIGGDSWRVHINGPTSVAGTIFDHSNGTYEIVFLVMEPGIYMIEVVLDHSLCDGYTDPPSNWFIIGSSQGKNQEEGVLGSERPYLLKNLWGGQPVTITIPPPSHEEPLLKEILTSPTLYDLSCSVQCRFLWDGFGNWVNNKQFNVLQWKPFIDNDDKPTANISSLFGERVRKDSVLWVYGDSVSEQFFSGIRRHPLCTRVFRWCGHTYNWVYKLPGNLSMAKSQNDDLDFDDVRVINEIDDVISQQIFDKNSVVLLNAGLHYLESSNFTNYKKMIDGVIRLFQRTKMDTRGQDVPLFPGKMIWKTTTSLNKNKLDGKHLQARRFLTSQELDVVCQQRVLLFNAYASQAMCRAGFHVLDVFPLTDAYPYGTGKPARPNDAVHYQHFVFESVERLLEDFFRRTTV